MTASLQIAALTTSEFFSRWALMSPGLKSRALQLRHRHHLREFARYCFPEVAHRPFNDFHSRILDRRKQHWKNRRRTQRRAYAAPRGIAKSTLTKIDVAHDIAFGLERVVVILSATRPDASGWSKTVRGWFSDKESALFKLYGPFTVVGGQEEFTITGPRGAVSVTSKSLRSDVRGYNVGTIRPSRVVLDDWESRKEVANPNTRRAWQKILNDDVLKLGDPAGGTLFDFVGTVLHPDSILNRILKKKAPNRGWASEKFKALIRFPDDAEVWEQCRGLYTDLDATRDSIDPGALALFEEYRQELDEPDAARLAAARWFYDSNREAMDAGSEVLDEHALPLFEIYVIIWDEGLASALKELNNDPTDPAERLFNPDNFKRCTYDPVQQVITTSAGKTIRLSECDVAVWLDPIPAESTGSDYAAVPAVAKHRKTKRRFVLTCQIGRVSTSEQRRWLWASFDSYGPKTASRKRLYGFEDNGFQKHVIGESWQREMDARSRDGKSANMRPTGYTSTENKVRRINRIQPDCENGYIEFSDLVPEEVLEQFRELPGATNDDGPDAIERADWLLGQGMPTITRGRRPS